MAGILLQRKELNRPGVFDETQWFKAYSKGLAQNTVTELKKAIDESNELVEDVTDMAGLLGYVEPKKVITV